MSGSGPRLLPLGDGDPAELGSYRLLGRLGSGGMGRVYLARSTTDGRLVAVKSLLAEGTVSDTDRRRFAREVALAGRVESAYTARVRDSDPLAECPWMAIDYIAAPSLAQLVQFAGVLPAPAVRWVAAGTTAALFTLHREGIVHRDVKPQNILLPMSGARVIDFGISHATDLTRTSVTLGTIAFTSPEQARGEPSTAASDIYSLGATLFHLAVGRPPYPEGEDTLRLLARVSRGDLDTTGLPGDLTRLVHRCLALDPGERPQPGDLLADFAMELAAPSASATGRHWLPESWARLMAEYEIEGAALAGEGSSATRVLRGGRAGAPPAAPAPAGPPPPEPAVPTPTAAVTPVPPDAPPAEPSATPHPQPSPEAGAGPAADGPAGSGEIADALTVDGTGPRAHTPRPGTAPTPGPATPAPAPASAPVLPPVPPPAAEPGSGSRPAGRWSREAVITLTGMVVVLAVLVSLSVPGLIGVLAAPPWSGGDKDDGAGGSSPSASAPASRPYVAPTFSAAAAPELTPGQCVAFPAADAAEPCDSEDAEYVITDVLREPVSDPVPTGCPVGTGLEHVVHSAEGEWTVVCVRKR
ncbi:serine/threonine-protein kinase [Streptomyces sp. NPDC004609]|uniref:serine/threonine-protein kinase n=1 Tax=Streptomyces sp. NPDC004609 TaxID=3364704 RepID=UPI0036CD5AFD